MTRLIPVATFLAFASCHPPTTPPTDKHAEEAKGFPTDYADWPTLTAEAVVTNQRAMLDCRAPMPFRLMPDGTSPEGVDSPHHIPALRYLVSPSHMAAVKDGKTPYPVGTTIVKEKLSDPESKKPFAVAAMVKHEAGYDPDHGDWEYVYTTLGEKPETQLGKISSCIACHRIKAEQDYLYRTYLPKPKK